METYFDLQKEGISYVDDEHILDYLRLADLILSILLYEREREDTVAGMKTGLGVEESQVRLALLASRQEYQGIWEYPEVQRAVTFIKGREGQSILSGDKTRLCYLSELFEMNFSQRFFPLLFQLLQLLF